MSEDFARLIRDSARALRRSFDGRVRKLGLTGEQAIALTSLARGEGVNQARFAELLDMEPFGLCRMVDRLEAAGLVRRERDPADRRARRLYLTRSGWDRIDQLRPLGQTLVDQSCSGVEPAELEAASLALRQMIANLAGSGDAGTVE